MSLKDAYKKALDFVHHLTEPFGSTTDPDDPDGLKKTSGKNGPAKGGAIEALKDNDRVGTDVTPTAEAK